MGMVVYVERESQDFEKKEYDGEENGILSMVYKGLDIDQQILSDQSLDLHYKTKLASGSSHDKIDRPITISILKGLLESQLMRIEIDRLIKVD